MKKTNHSLPVLSILSLALGALFISLSSGCSNTKKSNFANENAEKIDLNKPLDMQDNNKNLPVGEYVHNSVLVKDNNERLVNHIDEFDFVSSFQRLSDINFWYQIELNNGYDAIDVVRKLRSEKQFDVVDYDYIFKGDATDLSVDVSGNPGNGNNTNAFNTSHIHDAWNYMKQNELNPGGVPDVVVAVIDTGIDYNHIDLRNNIWKNNAEIPNNGIDDDNNGYVDDYCGWDFVGDDNDPMDDNGHGTHVAGIIAAENNNVGAVGVAYNCKVMAIKAGNSSGTFNDSNIAKAIEYAYSNGASIINMSFGGYSISLPVVEALENAYNSCALIAAAGNDGLCNTPNCQIHISPRHQCYPACLPSVVGVMSCNDTGTKVSSFSNFDCIAFDNFEYDCFVCGEQIYSTWPNNKYASLSGTSMSAPIVSGIAALLRSAYPDTDTFQQKFIYSQLTNTSEVLLDNEIPFYHTVCDALSSISSLPKPNIVGVYDYYIFDNVEFSNKNNGDGIINAGETVHIGIELQNRGGVASDIIISANTHRNGDESLNDPYISFITNDISINDIGTFSVGDCGQIRNERQELVDIEKPLIVSIDDTTPNDYYCDINIEIHYKNGLNSNDNTDYVAMRSINLTVTNGIILPDYIGEDINFTNEKRYIVAHDVIIPAGVNVTFEAGCTLEFYSDSYSELGLNNSPKISVFGSLVFAGTKDEFINIGPNENYSNYICIINQRTAESSVDFRYCNITNLVSSDPRISYSNDGTGTCCYNSHISYNVDFSQSNYLSYIENGKTSAFSGRMALTIFDMYNCIYDTCGLYSIFYILGNIENSIIYAYSTYSDLKLGGNNDYSHMTIKNNLIIFRNSDVISAQGQLILGSFNSTKEGISYIFQNNVFISEKDFSSYADFPEIRVNFSYTLSNKIQIIESGNVFYGKISNYTADLVADNFDLTGTRVINFNDEENCDFSKLPLFISSIDIYDLDSNLVQTIDSGSYIVEVSFNKEVDTKQEFALYYGSISPYRDAKVAGDFVSSTKWRGLLSVTSLIDGGRMYFACSDISPTDDWKKLANNASSYAFNFIRSSALAMNLHATSTENGILLEWMQDDYDTLMGYNVYRSNELDGNYIKLNSAVISSGEHEFLDENAEPGKTYWYTFTVVLSDFSESKPAEKISCTSLDDIAPTVFHTPVTQAYTNNNLVISCTALDNIDVISGFLYYRTIGETIWKRVSMSKQSDKWTGTIFGSELTTDGIEYYIQINDTNNSTFKGSSENPYTVIIKDSSVLVMLGDVDGDGIISTKDALLIIKAINGDVILTDDQFKKADLNKDEVLSSSEALRILQYVNGKINVLEM